MGGFRLGSGRSKSGYFQGIYCGSTYELCWVIYALDHEIEFKRFDGCIKNDSTTYFPDYLLSDNKTIIELKGYESNTSVDKKTKLAESFGYTVKVMRADDLTEIFNYVKTKYNTSKFYELYDGYKPKYDYNCNFCKNSFSRDHKIKTQEKYCSRQCAGKFRKSCKKSQKIGLKINCSRKLTKEQALYLFYESKKTLTELANEFNMTKGNVSLLKNKKIYKWIHN